MKWFPYLILLVGMLSLSAINEHTLEKGQIHDPRNDKWYKGRLTVGDDGRLEVRGWLGLPAFGKSQYWTRAN